MNGFQPITYGPSTKIDNTDVLQKLNNIQAYSGLILNNMGLPVDTGLVLPEYNYSGESSQPGYSLSYGINILHATRNYDYTLNITDQLMPGYYLEAKYKYDGIIYTAFLKYTKISATSIYFRAEPTFHSPLQINVCDNGIFNPVNFYAEEGRCGVKFTLDTSKAGRAPLSLLYLGKPRLQFNI